MRIITLFGCFILGLSPAMAQLASLNDAGVTMGHIHLTVKDIAAQTRFWTTMIGGTAVMNEELAEIQFPSVYIILRQGDSIGPVAGSVVDHFGFVFKDLPAAIVKWKANGLAVTQSTFNHNQGGVTGPEGIRLEVFGDPRLIVPVQMNHVHFLVIKEEIPKMQAWYAKVFGAMPDRRESVARPGNWVDSVDLPGDVNLSMSPSPQPMAPTKGRLIDHIGFEVGDMEAFRKKLASLGIMLEGPSPQSPDSDHLNVAFLTDPWGTRIELTEGLEPAR